MSLGLLLMHFERLSDTHEAIPRLRRFILDLAVRGELTTQLAEDKPASELLSQIHLEKERLVKAKATRKGVEALGPQEVPFGLPATWAWTLLGNVCSKTGSGSTPRGGQSAYKDHGVPFLRSQNIYNDGLRLEDVAYIDQKTHQRMEGTAVKPGDLLLNITGGSIGRCCRVPDDLGEANISQHVAIIRVVMSGTQEFMHLLIMSPYFQSFVLAKQTGAGRGGLPKNRMDRIPVAIPPLPEQYRIVVKVHELMTLCDRLEVSLMEREAARHNLLEAVLHQALTPA